MNKRHFILLFCLVLFVTVSFQAKAFKFQDSTGKIHTLADYKGKWVLINFWATWCPPCLEEIPDLIALYESRDDVMVIGIAMDYADPKDVMEYVDAMSISYPTVLGDRRIAAQIEELSMLPSTYLFNPLGQPAARQIGLITREEIEAFMRHKPASVMKNNHP
ncbi:MAG: TlpA family protein disulfide reductase [Nitrosomonas sp.]|nr:TlpA family protein disulfide reductase [Nitrosomonas sp.]